MKKLLPLVSVTLIFSASLFALPLTVIIFQESKKLTEKVAAWNKQCGEKPYYDEPCTKKRFALSADLAKFVATVNDELSALREPASADTPAGMLTEFDGRRKIMELEVRIALHNIKCLGVPDSDPQCRPEALAIEEEKTALQAEYKQTHAAFDGVWIPIHISKIEKKH